MPKKLPTPPNELRREIDELGGFPSERPSQVDFKISFASIPAPKGKAKTLLAIILALGAIAEVIHQLVK